MFDRTVVNQIERHTHIDFPDTIDVHEHKAPTDESIRLLNEFEEKARANIITKVNVADNIVNFISVAYTDNRATISTKGEVHIKFMINGKEHTIRSEFDMYTIKNKDELQLTKWLQDWSKARVASHIINNLQGQMLNMINGL